MYDPDTGEFAYLTYIPRTTKKDKGGVYCNCNILTFLYLMCAFILDRAPTHCANAFRRPLALKVGDGKNKYDLSYVLANQR